MDPLPDQNSEARIPYFEEVIVDLYEKSGIEAYDTKTVQQILKFMQKYIKEIYNKADLIRLHADKKREQVNVEDIKLAIDAHNENSFYKALPREIIESIAMRRNSNPIPQPKFYSNLIEQIPESDYTLTQPNFEVYDEEIQDRLKNSFLNHGRPMDEDSEDSLAANMAMNHKNDAFGQSSHEKHRKQHKRQKIDEDDDDVDFFDGRDSV